MVTRLELRRRGRGLSQNALAQIAKVHPSDVSRIENLRVRAYGCQAERISEVLQVRVEELFLEDGTAVEELGAETSTR